MRATTAPLLLAAGSIVSAQFTSVGCFSSSGSLESQGPYVYQSYGFCKQKCSEASVFALTGGDECFCGDEAPAASDRVDDSKCNRSCNGYPQNKCGGDGFWSVLTTGEPSNDNNSSQGSSGSPFPPFSGDAFEKLSISADGINASFIPYGARLTNLYVNDATGNPQDVAVGYDSGSRYLQDSETNHTFFGAVVGRYANRIKNGTFTIDGQTSHIPANEHGGANTLHGGKVGYDQRNWTVVSHTASSLTFSFYDDALEGFPGAVLNVATYTLTDEQEFISRLVSIPINEATPIMLSHHIYWNIGAFVDEEALTILNDTLQLPYADRYIQTDGILVPNGSIGVTKGTGLDFQKPTIIGDNIAKTNGSNFCGTGCVGIDNAFINDRNPYAGNYDPNYDVLHHYSPSTGIQLDVSTNQNGLQIYTCVGQNGTIPVKESQQHIQGATTYVEKYGCIVIETQDWVDGINNPQWGRDQYQIFSPTTEPAVNWAKFKFSASKTSKLTQQRK